MKMLGVFTDHMDRVLIPALLQKMGLSVLLIAEKYEAGLQLALQDKPDAVIVRIKTGELEEAAWLVRSLQESGGFSRTVFIAVVMPSRHAGVTEEAALGAGFNWALHLRDVTSKTLS
jgi:hypothetical protein